MTTIIDGSAGITFPNSTVQASAGQVLQVVQGTFSTAITTSSSTFSDTGLTASITPKFSNSKVLVLVSLSTPEKNSNNTYIRSQIVRNSTSVCYMTDIGQYTGNSNTSVGSSLSMNYLDSPATTSATTYKVQYASVSNNAAVAFNTTFGTPVVSTITLMEVAG